MSKTIYSQQQVTRFAALSYRGKFEAIAKVMHLDPIGLTDEDLIELIKAKIFDITQSLSGARVYY